MSLIPPEKILFLLSGGSSNFDPSSSLGGFPSSARVSGGTNGLFSDIPPAQATSGYIDYRCLYLRNSSESDFLYDSSVYVNSEVSGGSSIQIGVFRSSEKQTISIDGPADSGFLVLRLGTIQFSSDFAGSVSSFASNIVSSMSSVGLKGAVAEWSSNGLKSDISISFLGEMNNRSWPLLEVIENGLGPGEKPVISISRQSSGSPVNAVAPTIATPEVPPTGVAFEQTSPTARIELGTFGPGDTIPLWIKRTTPPDTPLKELDGVTIRLSGDPFGPVNAPSP
jgi:hypothetical protein